MNVIDSYLGSLDKVALSPVARRDICCGTHGQRRILLSLILLGSARDLTSLGHFPIKIDHLACAGHRRRLV